jgi:multiple sugar transport system permease protein/raffinose/stachyose/melibiose transport system permease protein
MSSQQKPKHFLSIPPRRWRQYAITFLLLIYTTVFSFPFFWAVANSFRPGPEILLEPYAVPIPPTLQNYVNVFTNKTLSFPLYFRNSIFVTASAILLAMFVNSMAAYGFARLRFKFRGREILYSVIFLSIMFPPQVTLLSLFQLLVRYKLYNTLWSLVLVYAVMSMPMNIFILRTFFAQIPRELEEAALIDGASDRQLFWRMAFPIARPAILTTVMLNFVNFWNEFLYAVTYINNPKLRTLPLAVMFFVGEAYLDVGMLTAAMVVSALPLILVYIFVSEWFIRGMTAGAIKA